MISHAEFMTSLSSCLRVVRALSRFKLADLLEKMQLIQKKSRQCFWLGMDIKATDETAGIRV